MDFPLNALSNVDRPIDDWNLAVAKRANMLLQGEEPETSRALGALTPWLRLPLWAWAAGMPLSLPVSRVGTLVLYNVEGLEVGEQTRLLHWIEHAGERVHIVSISSVPLHALVEFGGFLEDLYYRLNTVVVEADRIAAPRAGTSVRLAS